MSRFQNLTFLKVLSIIAWADGELTDSEHNMIKSFFQKFQLSPEELKEIRPYLLAPVPKDEQEKLFNQLIAELGSAREKLDVVRAMETLAQADQEISPEEKKLLNHFSDLLSESSFTRDTFGKIRNFMAATLFKPAREKNPELEKYFRQRVLNHVEIKLASENVSLELPEETIYKIGLMGTLLASVARADKRFEDIEREAVAKVLQERFGLSGEGLRVLSEVVEIQSRSEYDFHEVVTEMNRLFTYNERMGMVNCFFAIAASDGEVSFEEKEEIRRITKALRIPHETYIESKMKFLEQTQSDDD